MSDNQFKTRLEIAKSKISRRNSNKDKNRPSSIGVAFKMSTELVSAVVVGTIIGFILDNWFGTKPVLIIVFFLFGATAGIVNVFRSAKRMQKNGN